MIKTIQDKKFNNTIVTYVTTMKVMTKTMTTIVTKNGQIASIALSSSPGCLLNFKSNKTFKNTFFRSHFQVILF